MHEDGKQSSPKKNQVHATSPRPPWRRPDQIPPARGKDHSWQPTWPGRANALPHEMPMEEPFSRSSEGRKIDATTELPRLGEHQICSKA